MLSLQAISDRLELQDLTYAYSRAIDTRDFTALENDVFSPDATIDYRTSGGPAGNIANMLEWVRPGMAAYGESHHLMANHQFEIRGDRATGRVMCYNPLQGPLAEDGSRTVEVHGHFYIDEYIRTQQGWRIMSRKLDKSYCYGTMPNPWVS